MPSPWVLATFGGAALLAFVLLYFARARVWYWHVLSILLALAIGLVPLPPEFNSPNVSLAIGFFFTFLLLWGAGAPFFRKRKHA